MNRSVLVAALGLAASAGLCTTAYAQCSGMIVDPEQGHAFVYDPGAESVNAATRWDPDGAGPKQEWLVVAGQFRRAATQMSQSIVAWDGVRWHSMDAGLDPLDFLSPVAITDIENLSGTLVALGDGLADLTSYVMRWNGERWEQFGDPVFAPGNRATQDMAVHNGQLYIAGAFTFMPTPTSSIIASPVIRRVGESWETVGPRLYGNNARMSRLESAPEGLYGAGSFVGVGVTGSQVVLNNVGLWNGTQWLPLGDGLNNAVRDTAYFNGQLYVVGTFTQSGATPLPGIARWDGTQWHAVGDGSHGTATAIEAHNGSIYISSTSASIVRILRLEGDAWVEVARPGQAPTGVSAGAAMSALVSDAEGLLVLGRFAAVSGLEAGSAAVIKQDGAIRTLGAGFSNPTTLLNLDGQLIARTRRRAGDEITQAFARWNGREWTNLAIPVPLGSVENAGSHLLSVVNIDSTSNFLTVQELIDGVWQDLPGAFEFPSSSAKLLKFTEYAGEIYASGPFISVGGTPIKGLARWNGAQWTQVGDGLNTTATTYTYYSDFAEVDSDLYVAGPFDRIGSQPITGIARWDGSSLVPVVDPDVTLVHSIVNWNGSVAGLVSINTPSGLAARVARWNGASWDVVAPIPLPEGPTGAIRSLLPVGEDLWAMYMDYPNKSYLLKLNDNGAWDRASGTFAQDISGIYMSYYLADALVFNNEIHVFGSFSREGDHVAMNWARFSADGVPLIVTQPQDAIAPCGESVELRATVANGYDADGELEYQWFRNGEALSETQFVRGVNTDTLTIPSLAQPFTGFYSVAVTNACGTATSREVIVTGDSLDCRVCAPCAADFDLDGGVTADDVASFFTSLETGNSCADVDHDGSVTGSDLAAFFTLYEAGGC